MERGRVRAEGRHGRISPGCSPRCSVSQGSEIVTIAAAESEEPRKNIKKAVRAVVWRLGLFYIGSIFVVVSLVPWNSDTLADGSYQAVLDRMNIPGAGRIMDVVLVVAVSSCLNSAIYTASRMAFSWPGAATPRRPSPSRPRRGCRVPRSSPPPSSASSP
ncbi:amino acid permease [Streptomyces thinghirensis]|nr:amino acid permease [Streptomyces thinghirensis]